LFATKDLTRFIERLVIVPLLRQVLWDRVSVNILSVSMTRMTELIQSWRTKLKTEQASQSYQEKLVTDRNKAVSVRTTDLLHHLCVLSNLPLQGREDLQRLVDFCHAPENESIAAPLDQWGTRVAPPLPFTFTAHSLQRLGTPLQNEALIRLETPVEIQFPTLRHAPESLPLPSPFTTLHPGVQFRINSATSAKWSGFQLATPGMYRFQPIRLKPNTSSVKHDEPSTSSVKHDEPNTSSVKHEESNTSSVKHEASDPSEPVLRITTGSDIEPADKCGWVSPNSEHVLIKGAWKYVQNWRHHYLTERMFDIIVKDTALSVHQDRNPVYYGTKASDESVTIGFACMAFNVAFFPEYAYLGPETARSVTDIPEFAPVKMQVAHSFDNVGASYAPALSTADATASGSSSSLAWSRSSIIPIVPNPFMSSSVSLPGEGKID